MSEKLLNCPICQNKTQWCDFDGEKISGECCDNIECKSCGLLFQFDDRSEHGRDTLQELQSDNAKAFNKRTLPQEVKNLIVGVNLLFKDMPQLNCDHFHHAKKDQHNWSAVCQVEARHYSALAILRSALKSIEEAHNA